MVNLNVATLSTSSLALLKLAIGLVPHEQVNDFLQGRALIPKSLHNKLVAHLDAAQKRKAEELRQQLAEAQANYTGYIASMGIVPPDYAEFEGVLDLDDEEEPEPEPKKGRSKASKTNDAPSNTND
jgi:hypothetical protein